MNTKISLRLLLIYTKWPGRSAWPRYNSVRWVTSAWNKAECEWVHVFHDSSINYLKVNCLRGANKYITYRCQVGVAVAYHPAHAYCCGQWTRPLVARHMTCHRGPTIVSRYRYTSVPILFVCRDHESVVAELQMNKADLNNISSCLVASCYEKRFPNKTYSFNSLVIWTQTSVPAVQATPCVWLPCSLVTSSHFLRRVRTNRQLCCITRRGSNTYFHEIASVNELLRAYFSSLEHLFYTRKR